MSEMTRAQEEAAAGAMLDMQIDKLLEPPAWFDDSDEVMAFARWYWSGALNVIGTAGEILDYFEKPWMFNEEYAGYSNETH